VARVVEFFRIETACHQPDALFLAHNAFMAAGRERGKGL
jgi:hypothetical protein